MTKMLILRGMAGTYDGVSYPRGALHEDAAVAYARGRGYEGVVLDVAGVGAENSRQHLEALRVFRDDPNITALYGFSAGGYNLRHIINDLTDEEKKRLNLVVCIGAPQLNRKLLRGTWELVYRNDPSHMDGPFSLLGELVVDVPGT